MQCVINTYNNGTATITFSLLIFPICAVSLTNLISSLIFSFVRIPLNLAMYYCNITLNYFHGTVKFHILFIQPQKQDKIKSKSKVIHKVKILTFALFQNLHNMGQQNSYQAGSNGSMKLVQQLPIGKVFKDQKSDALYFIKEYAYTSEEAFQQAFLKFSSKLTTKNDNILNLQKTNTKVDNTFCSTFYKIVLIFDFVNYSLADEIVVRNKENRTFEEKEIWSILFHCTLGISHLKRTEGIEHSAIGLKDIKLSQDGTIKVLPIQMVGIYNEHDQNEGTTKKLAMTILSCLLMKHISNQSSQYLQALIDKTRCSKELKKVLYFMIMDDTTFKELQEYLFKLANDENDSLLSGVSTPLYSSHKRSTTIQQSNIKKMSQDYLSNRPTKMPLTCMMVDQEDTQQILTVFETFEEENHDQNDEDKDFESIPEDEKQNMILPSYESQTFSIEGNINIDYKLKDNSNLPNSENQDDATVRLMSKKQSDAPEFANPSKSEFASIKSDGLYTDPKLLDLIKKDLQEIQQKSRISFGANNNESSDIKFKVQSQQKTSMNENQNSSFKKSSYYSISGPDFSIKAVSKENVTLNSGSEENVKPEVEKSEKKQIKEPQKKVESIADETFKEIQNIPLRTREQQCYGNILDEEASFKKEKPKKLTAPTAREPEFKKSQQKENVCESSETKRTVQGYQQKNETATFSIKQKVSEGKLTPQQLLQNSKSQSQTETTLMEFVNETYQKGEYKGYKMGGLRHGQGTFYYKEGGKYIGEWKENKMNGKGTLYYPNDQVAYDGNWKDDQLHGYGTLYNEEVTILQKSFDYQDWAMVEQFWVKYEGEFYMDNKQGRGKLYLSNGQIFEGWFKEDMIDGQGVLTRENGSRVRGIWRKNKLLRIY